MKDEEILKLAIEKAVKSGWEDFNELTSVVRQKEYPYDRGEAHLLQKCFSYIEMHLYPIHIFSHSFAKAFWGEGQYCRNRKCGIGSSEKEVEIDFGSHKGMAHKCNVCGYEFQPMTPTPAWRHHLQNMVLEEYPIKYLEKFISPSRS